MNTKFPNVPRALQMAVEDAVREGVGHMVILLNPKHGIEILNDQRSLGMLDRDAITGESWPPPYMGHRVVLDRGVEDFEFMQPVVLRTGSGQYGENQDAED